MMKQDKASSDDYRLNLRLSKSNPVDQGLINYIESRPTSQSKVDRVRELYNLGMTAPITQAEMAEFKRLYQKLNAWQGVDQLLDQPALASSPAKTPDSVRKPLTKPVVKPVESVPSKKQEPLNPPVTDEVAKDPVLIDDDVPKESVKPKGAPTAKPAVPQNALAGLFNSGLVVDSDD